MVFFWFFGHFAPPFFPLLLIPRVLLSNVFWSCRCACAIRYIRYLLFIFSSVLLQFCIILYLFRIRSFCFLLQFSFLRSLVPFASFFTSLPTSQGVTFFPVMHVQFFVSCFCFFTDFPTFASLLTFLLCFWFLFISCLCIRVCLITGQQRIIKL